MYERKTECEHMWVNKLYLWCCYKPDEKRFVFLKRRLDVIYYECNTEGHDFGCTFNFYVFCFHSRCVHITDIGVGYISTMLSLTALFMRWCTQIRDFGLQHLCSMRNLQVLSLAGCPQLTSSGLSSLIQLRHLQELELTNCPGSSQELFEYLREHLPRCLIIE